MIDDAKKPEVTLESGQFTTCDCEECKPMMKHVKPIIELMEKVNVIAQNQENYIWHIAMSRMINVLQTLGGQSPRMLSVAIGELDYLRAALDGERASKTISSELRIMLDSLFGGVNSILLGSVDEMPTSVRKAVIKAMKQQGVSIPDELKLYDDDEGDGGVNIH